MLYNFFNGGDIVTNSRHKKWECGEIENEIKKAVEKAKLKTFPTHSQIKEITGSYSLSNAIRRNGGTAYWAQKMNLDMKSSESKTGLDYELKCISILTGKGYECDKMRERYPYDLTVNKHIKIDVKSGKLYNGKSGNFYTFNLEKSNPTCDIFICFCVEKSKIYVIPSCALYGITQLSIGEHHSKYDKYIDRWDIIRKYDEFYKELST